MKRRTTGNRKPAIRNGRRTVHQPTFATTTGAIPLPIALLNRTGKLVSANPAFLSFLGATMKEVKGAQWLEKIFPDDRGTVESTLIAALAAKQPLRMTCRVRTPDDRVRTCEWHTLPWKTTGRGNEYVTTVIDVTSRDTSAHHARAIALALTGLTENIDEMYIAVDDERRIVRWNPAIARFSRIPQDSAVGHRLAELVGIPELDAALAVAVSTRRPQRLERMIWPGHGIPLDCKVFPIGVGCGILFVPAAVQAAAPDTTGPQENEDRYHGFVENSSEGISRFRIYPPIPVDLPVGEQVSLIRSRAILGECNTRLAQINGQHDALALADMPLATVLQLDIPRLEECLTWFVTAGYRLGNIELSRLDSKGDVQYLMCSLVGGIERGCLVQVWGTLRDATEQREAERRLRLLAQALTSVRDAISITDTDDRILFVNEAFIRTYGFPEEQLLGQNIEMVRPTNVSQPSDGEIRKATLEGGWYGELLNRRVDGSVFPVELWTSVVHNDEGDPVALVGVAREITERKKTEENLRTSLREKEVLLKEIHHRVKNNLQVISSLLSLQAGYLTDEGMIRVIQESQNRVKSMALVHEKLYQSINVAEIDFGDYLRTLLRQLTNQYGVSDERITVNVRADAVSLGVDRAIPCGIIVNELVTNALKYAFPGTRSGMIEVELKSISHGVIRLIIRDDGVGFPPDVDVETTKSLGLTLVHMLVDQVKGELQVPSRPAGVEYVLVFRK